MILFLENLNLEGSLDSPGHCVKAMCDIRAMCKMSSRSTKKTSKTALFKSLNWFSSFLFYLLKTSENPRFSEVFRAVEVKNWPEMGQTKHNLFFIVTIFEFKLAFACLAVVTC